MHLLDILALRSTPAAGVSVGITRRCPLHCAHCSTQSTPHSEELPERILLQFVESFTNQSHPQVLSLSGGEAMLRPELVKTMAEKAHHAGSKVSLLTGLFFARHGHVPATIQTALKAVDHCSISLDRYHQEEVPPDKAFQVIQQLHDSGLALSLHIMGEHSDDPYLDTIVAEVKQRFGTHIPMVVNILSPFGRGVALLRQLKRSNASPPSSDGHFQPCTMAAWPVVGFDGVVAACGNDHLIGHVPEHLRLGNIHTDGWPSIAERCLQSHTLRALRLLGPVTTHMQFNSTEKNNETQTQLCAGSPYCNNCMALKPNAILQKQLANYMNKLSTQVLEQTVTDWQITAGPLAFAQRYTHPRFVDLIHLGAR